MTNEYYHATITPTLTAKNTPLNQLPSTNQKPHSHFRAQGYYALFNANVIDSFSPQFFSQQYWQEQQAVIGTAQGRGTTYFVKYHTQQWVLRHYFRGGLIGRLLNDQYFFSGYQNTRAVREYQLLAYLQQQQLPAPMPVACQIKRTGFYYQADILTARIDNASDLVSMLTLTPLANENWHNIGACIAMFHHHHVYHHDLNCHNILLDKQGKVWLIDFDQGSIRSGNGKWRQRNLDRLHRSFLKEKHKLPQFYFEPEQWQHLLNGYLEKFNSLSNR
ncbi:3-deoxy-D-manno-octulosonic acid kinase [Thalassotalea ganghwensis]